MSDPPAGPPEDPSEFRAPGSRDGDFLGAFAVVRRQGRILMVQNRRVIAGRAQRVWDLPGGQVEPGELLRETLARELAEETGLEAAGRPRLLFVQEGVKRVGGTRRHAWRSFFFAVAARRGRPRAGGEVLQVAWWDPERLHRELRAPYHDSFLTWLRGGGRHFVTAWDE